MTIQADFENIKDGERITLYPNADNPLHKRPITATFVGGYYYCDGTRPEDGPDYYFRDVALYNSGFTRL